MGTLMVKIKKSTESHLSRKVNRTKRNTDVLKEIVKKIDCSWSLLRENIRTFFRIKV